MFLMLQQRSKPLKESHLRPRICNPISYSLNEMTSCTRSLLLIGLAPIFVNDNSVFLLNDKSVMETTGIAPISSCLQGRHSTLKLWLHNRNYFNAFRIARKSQGHEPYELTITPHVIRWHIWGLDRTCTRTPFGFRFQDERVYDSATDP